MQETVVPQMRGGEKSVAMRTRTDSLCKIIRGKPIPGASIGFHTHETDSEVLYILSGGGKIFYDDTCETLAENSCHYCPKGHAHNLINNSDEVLIYFAVVSTHQS